MEVLIQPSKPRNQNQSEFKQSLNLKNTIFCPCWYLVTIYVLSIRVILILI